jgi:phage major head subunit gpT-like protein
MGFNPIAIERGLRAGFAQRMAEFLAAREINPGLMSAAEIIQSNGAYEKMGWIGAMPVVQQWLGEKTAKELSNYDFTVRNLDWYTGVPVNENDINDDQVAVLRKIPQLLVKRTMSHPEKLMIEFLTAGTGTTKGAAYDGVAFFSDVSGARTIDNLLGGTGTTLAQLEADLNAALVAMARFTDDQGEVLNIRGNLIVCPVALENKFARLVNSQTDPTATAQGTFNPYGGRFTVVGDPRLDAADVNDWYLLATNEIVKPFVFSMRQESKPDFEKKSMTKTWIASADYRGNAAYGLPHLAVKTVNGG